MALSDICVYFNSADSVTDWIFKISQLCLISPQWWVVFNDELSWLFTTRFRLPDTYMKVKRMGITEILRKIWQFSANEIKSSESVNKQPTQLIIVAIIVTIIFINRRLLHNTKPGASGICRYLHCQKILSLSFFKLL